MTVKVIDCADRDRLGEILRVAAHELAWAVQEECRVLRGGDLDGSDHMASVIELGQKHRRQALASFRKHIQSHGCVQKASGARP